MDAHEGDSDRGQAPQLASTAETNAASHAGVLVLGSRMLWDRITGFMTGYPFVVHKFSQESDPTALYGQWVVDILPMHLVGHLTRDGVLPHLAIAVNNLEILRLLFKLTKHPDYQRDPKLSFRKAISCAVLYNSVEMLECINQLKAGDPEWQWELCLMCIALQRVDTDIQVLDWLHTHLSPKSYSLSEKLLMYHVGKANLEIVQWLHEHKRKISQAAVDEAAKRGLAQVLGYFYERSGKRCSLEAVNHAAEEWPAGSGQVPGREQNQSNAPRVIDYAAGNGHLEIVKYLHKNYFDSGCTSQAMTDTTAFGRLDIVQFLYEHHTEGCTPDALDHIAQHGHLEITKFLRDKYALKCSASGMDAAAANGHLEVLRFLDELADTEGYLVRAIDGAARNGHLEVVKFLHFNRTEGCTEHTMRLAAMNGHYGVVEFLSKHRSEGDVVSALTNAVEYGHLEIVKLLHSKLQPSELTYPAVEAAVWCLNIDMIQFLCENQIPGSMSILKHAVTNGTESVVLAVLQYSALEDLVDAKEYALGQNKPEIAGVIAKHTLNVAPHTL